MSNIALVHQIRRLPTDKASLRFDTLLQRKYLNFSIWSLQAIFLDNSWYLIIFSPNTMLLWFQNQGMIFKQQWRFNQSVGTIPIPKEAAFEGESKLIVFTYYWYPLLVPTNQPAYSSGWFSAPFSPRSAWFHLAHRRLICHLLHHKFFCNLNAFHLHIHVM